MNSPSSILLGNYSSSIKAKGQRIYLVGHCKDEILKWVYTKTVFAMSYNYNFTILHKDKEIKVQGPKCVSWCWSACHVDHWWTGTVRCISARKKRKQLAKICFLNFRCQNTQCFSILFMRMDWNLNAWQIVVHFILSAVKFYSVCSFTVLPSGGFLGPPGLAILT